MALNSKLASIPLINSPAQLQQMIQVWRQALSRTVKVAPSPPPPLNFRVTNARGGLLLQWGQASPTTKSRVLGEATTQTGPDGYEILASRSGDFVSDVEVFSLNDITQTQHFYSTGGGAAKCSFKIHTTAGNPYTPNSTFGPDSGTIRHTSLDASDVSSRPTTVHDNTTSDVTRAKARLGRYASQYLKTYGRQE